MRKAICLRSLFFNSNKIVRKIQPQLQELEKEVKGLEDMNNQVEAIVKLFQIISPIQDAGGFSEEIAKIKKSGDNVKIQALENLQDHIQNAGRSKFGMNRTEVGDEVTFDKVFVGGVYGLFEISATHCLYIKSQLEESVRHDFSEQTEWQLINDHQCRNFVKSHTDGVLNQIHTLLKV